MMSHAGVAQKRHTRTSSLLHTKATAAAKAATSDPSCLNYFLPLCEWSEQVGIPVPVQSNVTLSYGESILQN